jgi:glycosyltransferase involved in cell wall biosynthesis
VIVTSPELVRWLPRSLGARKLVYDCPDDALAFRQAAGVRAAKARAERELIARADVIACASDELASRLRERGADPARVCVIRNGWDPQAFPVMASTSLPGEGALRLAYFGTLAPWLDLEGLGEAAREAGPLSIRLIGPRDQLELVQTPGITLEPPLPHGELAGAVADAHCMLLPFRVDALTRAVDPVKLYEYIALGKPILSAYWPALEPFARFVTFYRDIADLVARLRERRVATPPPREERLAFLEPQSWQARAELLHQAIAGVRLVRRDGAPQGAPGA